MRHTDILRGEGHIKMKVDIVVYNMHRPENTKTCYQPPEARRET